MPNATKPTVFISYSHKDEDWKDRLVPHLEVLSDKGLLDLWDDRKLGAGDDWRDEIGKAMATASVAILLISANSLTSKFIQDQEVTKLLKRRDKEGLTIFPVIVKACPWKEISWLARMQVRPKDGRALAAFGGNRRDEAMSDIATEIYQQFKPAPGSSEERKLSAPDRSIEVIKADVLSYACDALVLKYAQGWHGVDRRVADALKIGSSPDSKPAPGKFAVMQTKGQIAAQNVLLLGVPPLHEFGYKEIRQFAARAMKTLAAELPGIRHAAMTMHGVGYGLDEQECFLAQIGGLAEALQTRDVPQFLERVTIAERDSRRADRLKQLLKGHLTKKKLPSKSRANKFVLSTPVKEAGVKSSAKPHVFVAIDNSDESNDVYDFGIQAPANNAGYLCERLDAKHIGNGALEQARLKIDNAAVFVAHLGGSDHDVYFQLGYASAQKKRTLLLGKKSESLSAVYNGQNVIVYKNISELAKSVEKELTAALKSS